MMKQEIQVFASGSSENKPVLFIHGFPFDHHMWDAQVNELKSRYYCVTYDVRGLGVSPAGDGLFTLESFVDDLEFIINNYKLNKPVLCGLSMGGYIAFRCVERMESKLGGLILCDTKSEPDTNEGKLKRAEGIKNINSDGLQKFISNFVPNCFAEKYIKDFSKGYNEILSRSLNYDPAGVKGCLLAMQGRTDVTPYLSGINIPSLIICGEEDKFTPPAAMRLMSKKISNSEFAIIPGAGHMSPVENPGVFTKIINDFLAKHFV
ncbi:MAG: alpha/beta hydrolase [Ignavibacteriaceae bacterium]|nr:alpha/beta hydrolase [Ignavibacteriaceae bacterium]